MKRTGSGYSKITIDASNLEGVKKAVKRIVDEQKQKAMLIVDEFGKDVCEYGIAKAKEFAPKTPKSTGELRDSIDGKYANGVVTISAGTDHALFVEYGTGVKGKGTHPEDVSDVYAYDVNDHGKEGWVYKKGDKFYHTTGQVANPYMYNTAKDINENANAILNKTLMRLGYK